MATFHTGQQIHRAVLDGHGSLRGFQRASWWGSSVLNSLGGYATYNRPRSHPSTLTEASAAGTFRTSGRSAVDRTGRGTYPHTRSDTRWLPWLRLPWTRAFFEGRTGEPVRG